MARMPTRHRTPGKEAYCLKYTIRQLGYVLGNEDQINRDEVLFQSFSGSVYLQFGAYLRKSPSVPKVPEELIRCFIN